MTRGWLRYQVGDFRLEAEWRVEPGEILVLFGASGSGKTMTLRALAGLIRPQEGLIEIGGSIVFDDAQRRWTPPHLRQVGYLPQDSLLFPHLDVAGNIGYGLGASARATRRRRVAELVERLRLQGLERRRVHELSGGQTQRVALARALAVAPAVLLLDEPFSALDMELRRSLRRELRGVLKESRVPIILVTHDKEEAVALGDTVQVLDHGQVIARGEPLPVLGHPTEGRVARLVGVENVLQLAVSALEPAEGVMLCQAGAVRLEVPLADVRPGDQISVGVRAADILLASQEPAGLSARNRLPGTVQSVEPHGAGYEVTLDCGLPLRCHVTRRAVAALDIRPGVALWAIIKASSISVLSD